ncbi:hypothetical protein [Flavobacterium sp. SM2513]|uniref:hypothetical protein n=1 Tax=Flavobacterium sp. SM2513 TaxID=3424766 RepID=UPI003D7F9559
MSQIIKMFLGKCPHCEKGQVFYKNGNPFLFQMPKMNKNCQECGHRFEREPGYFFGAMYGSYLCDFSSICYRLSTHFLYNGWNFSILDDY